MCFVAVSKLRFLAGFFHELDLGKALNLNLFVSKLDGFQHFVLTHFAHFAFYHQNVVGSSGYNKFNITTIYLS